MSILHTSLAASNLLSVKILCADNKVLIVFQFDMFYFKDSITNKILLQVKVILISISVGAIQQLPHTSSSTGSTLGAYLTSTYTVDLKFF